MNDRVVGPWVFSMASADEGRGGSGRPRSVGPVEVRELGVEEQRLEEDGARKRNWKRWGPYLSERQWGTVREDYSPDGDCWDYFPHDHARSRAYRWGEDGLLGITDRECRLCFALALWNGKDPILKERLFGLDRARGQPRRGRQGAVLLPRLDADALLPEGALQVPARPSSPTRGSSRRTAGAASREPRVRARGHRRLRRTTRYFDVFAEYAKASPDDILIRITLANRGRERRRSTCCRRSGSATPGLGPRAARATASGRVLRLRQGRRCAPSTRRWAACASSPAASPDGGAPEWLFTENETNSERLCGTPNATPYVKDAFHEYVVRGRQDAVNPARTGTKAAALYRLELAAGGRGRRSGCGSSPRTRRRRSPSAPTSTDGVRSSACAKPTPSTRLACPPGATTRSAACCARPTPGCSGRKQFYHYVVKDWLDGDPAQPAPPDERQAGRNADWPHLYNRDVISMPDKWEYPWYAAWDLAFHMIPFATVDPHFAKEQLLLFLREWYMHPNGQIPAYEFAFGDVNPPVHAWACWRVYKMTGARGARDRAFLARVLPEAAAQLHLVGEPQGRGGQEPLRRRLPRPRQHRRLRPLASRCRRAATSSRPTARPGWRSTAPPCSRSRSSSPRTTRPTRTWRRKFFEHFVAIADAMNTLGGTGLWDEEDGFYYDQLHVDGREIPLKIRSLVGLIPLFAVEILEDEVIDRLPGFKKRMAWFLENRPDLAALISCMKPDAGGHRHRLLAIPSRERLERVLRYMLDENEFLSPYGMRSLSRVHAEQPYVFGVGGDEHRVDYVPGEGTSRPLRRQLELARADLVPAQLPADRGAGALPPLLRRRLHGRVPDRLRRARDARRRWRASWRGAWARSSCPTPPAAARATATTRATRATRTGGTSCSSTSTSTATRGRGVGASHQTGWTALVVPLLRGLAARRSAGASQPAHAHGHTPVPAGR